MATLRIVKVRSWPTTSRIPLGPPLRKTSGTPVSAWYEGPRSRPSIRQPVHSIRAISRQGVLDAEKLFPSRRRKTSRQLLRDSRSKAPALGKGEDDLEQFGEAHNGCSRPLDLEAAQRVSEDDD